MITFENGYFIWKSRSFLLLPTSYCLSENYAGGHQSIVVLSPKLLEQDDKVNEP